MKIVDILQAEKAVLIFAIAIDRRKKQSGVFRLVENISSPIFRVEKSRSNP